MRAGSPCAMSHSRWAIAIRACPKSITVIYRPVYRRYGPRRLRYARDRGTLERRSDRAGTGAFHPDAVEEHRRKSTRSQPTQPSRLGRQNDRSYPRSCHPGPHKGWPGRVVSGRWQASYQHAAQTLGRPAPKSVNGHSWSDRDDIRSKVGMLNCSPRAVPTQLRFRDNAGVTSD